MPKQVCLIFRSYDKKDNIHELLKIKNECKKFRIKFYLSNNIRLAIKLSLDGAYIPSFNKSFNHNAFKLKKGFKLIGSAHNIYEIKIKEKQNISKIFLSPLFKTTKKKDNLGIYKFIKLAKQTKKNVVCLGGVRNYNIKKINMMGFNSIASITMLNNYDK